MPLTDEQLRKIFGESDEQPEPAAFLRCDGTDLLLDRELECSACRQRVLTLSYSPRVQSHIRRESIADAERSLRRLLATCPYCGVEWEEPPHAS